MGESGGRSVAALPSFPFEQLHWLEPTHGRCTSVEQSARSFDLGTWEIILSSLDAPESGVS